jgi:hypothetical protein
MEGAMIKEEEKQYWAGLITDLNKLLTISAISAELGTDERQVWRWKAGDTRPMGMMAVKVYLLHFKRCPVKPVITDGLEKVEH